MNIGIIGFGKMGEAIAKGLLRARGYRVFYNEIREERIEEVRRKYPQVKHLSLEQLIDVSEAIILSVKPQDLDELLKKVDQVLKREKLFISICAGISISYIQERLSKCRVIRCMPNMGALIGKSFTAICKGPRATDKDLELAISIFSTIGKVKEVKEDLMNAITAVSGSGPAYLAYFANAMGEAAKEIGLSEAPLEIVLECIKTTVSILEEMGISPQELIGKVASKGGTTEACLKVWDERGFKEIIKEGIKRAKQRAEELGR